jgi:hypothetical protein
MNKDLLYSAVKKVFLDLKDVEHFIFWDVDKSKLSLKSLDVAYNTTVMSTSTVSKIDMTNTSIVLKDPDVFLKILDITNDDVTIEIKKIGNGNNISIKDSNFESDIVVADSNFIPQHILEKKNTEPEEPISYDVTMDIDSAFIDKFIKAKKANKSGVVSIWNKDRSSYFQLGDPNDFSNKITFSITADAMFDMDVLLFSSDIIQIIFERNKKSTGKMSVDPSGLMKIEFQERINDISLSAVYFLVAQDNL